MSVILATGANQAYLERMVPYLGSIQKRSNFDRNVLVFVGHGAIQVRTTGGTPDAVRIEVVTLSPNRIEAPNPSGCVQHGDFLNAPQLDATTSDDDVIFFTDGDMILQRSLDPGELTAFRGLADGDVYVGYNASPIDTLAAEAPRLGWTGFMPRQFDARVWATIKVYNTGVLAMNKRTWRKLLASYVALYPHVVPMFPHYARQQWLICFIVGTDPAFRVIEMPYDIHNHRHYPSPAGTVRRPDGSVYHDGKKVLFLHNWHPLPKRRGS